MSARQNLPFYRQISGVLTFLFLSFLLILSLVLFLLYQRNVQIFHVVNVQVPQIEFGYKYNHLLNENNKLSASLYVSKSGNDLESNFGLFSDNIHNISQLYKVSSPELTQLLFEIKTINETVNRIQNNEPRNVTLKQTVMVQLRLLSNDLLKQVDEKTIEHSLIQQAISANGINGYISALKANSYIELNRVINQLNKAISLLDNAIEIFDNVHISSPVDSLDRATKHIDLAIATWLSVLTNSPEDMVIRGKIETLKQLLYVVQRASSKWYSHLRLAEEVFARTKLVNQTLNDLSQLNHQTSYSTQLESVIPPFIDELVRKTGVVLTPQYYYYGLIAVLSLSIFILLIILISLKRKLYLFGQSTTQLCDVLVTDTHSKVELDNYVKSSEHLRIVGLIQQIKKPAHSENQYQELLKQHEKILTHIYTHHKLAYWSYTPSKRSMIDNDVLKELCGVKNKNITSWRQLFDKNTVQDIIAMAKSVRNTQTSLFCNVTTQKKVRLDLVIEYEYGAWIGTLHKNDKIELLQASLAVTKKKLKATENDSYEELSASTDKFGKMILRAMLQSQGSSVDSNGASLQVYRQLTRIYDWCRQSNIITQLQSDTRKVAKSNISFVDELHAALFNAMTEAHLQRNQLFIQTDRQLTEYAIVDHRLFHRMLLGVIRVCLAELFNAKMLLSLKVIDISDGSQTVRFTFSILSAKALKSIPELVSRLVNEDRKVAASSDIVFYLRTLMYQLNINDVQTELHDNGFKLFFDTHIVEGPKLNQVDKNSPVNLKQANIISLSSCDFTQNVVSTGIASVGGLVRQVTSVEQLSKQFCIKELIHRPIKVIVVGDDIFRKDLDKVENYITTLPIENQPKLLIMQPAMGSLIHKVGLYSQASTPLCQTTFLANINQLIKGAEKDNSLMDKELLSQFHYLPTRVEVLVAIEKPEQHQVLIRVLHWLGLQVHVVCQPTSMIKHWLSGRYLVLMTEFNLSPFVMLTTGKNVHRGVFTFKDMLFDTPTGALAKVTKNWKVSTIPNALDIKGLVNLLDPWLKSKASETIGSIPPKVPVQKVRDVQSFNEFLSEADGLTDADKDYLNYAKILMPEDASLSDNAAFDLEKYAINQGSSELAAYMINEYIEDIECSLNSLTAFIETSQLAQTTNVMTILIKVSEVMAAKELNLSCLALSNEITKATNNHVGVEITQALIDVKKQAALLIEYAEAI